MIALLWLRGLVRRRPIELAGAALAIALAVGFLSSLGNFVAVNRAHLTSRAAASVGVDWQVQVAPGASTSQVAAAVTKLPGRRAVEQIALAAVPGMTASTGGATRTTGKAIVVAMSPSYVATFPTEVRQLLGDQTGPVLLQQTAANLAAGPGDTVQVRTVAGRSVKVVVTGVVDMPLADSFFQTVGAPAGVGPAAPPDNVLLVPPADFPQLAAGAAVIHQVHVSFNHQLLPADPAAAANRDTTVRNHLEAQLTGGALVGDNLGAALTAAREDALYGQLLILLLGVPGFLVALALTAVVIGVRGDRRLRELSLLRLRGATRRSLVVVAALEATAVTAVGVALGWPVTRLASGWAFGASTTSWSWFAVAAVLVAATAAAMHIGPSMREMRAGVRTLPGVRAVEVPASGRPRVLAYRLDFVLLAAAAVVFYLVARGGYQVVVVPEGVPVTSVDWAALLAPALAWPGLALLVWRIVDTVLSRLRPVRDGAGAELVLAALKRRRRGAARGATALAVAIGVAGSTAVFTATYRQQSRLDVALTVGADVAVQLPADPATAQRDTALTAHAPHVRATSLQTHRFAYVGSDLQDLYGVDPATIAKAAPLRDAFVPGTTIASDLSKLRSTPDGVLLAAETLHDYQLHPGDTIRLRLQSGAAHTYQPFPFTVLGQVSEWPTAPKDSFIVANAAYIAKITGAGADTTVLAASNSPGSTAQWLRSRLGTTAKVSDISAARASVTTASGLAASDLGGLARLELGFGVLLAVASFGLSLLVGVLQRRRALVILAALGATARQRGRFLAAEARAVLAGGLVGGAAITAAVAAMLVKVMTGIFDPPPDHPVIPWSYLALVVALVTVTAVVVVAVVGRWAGRAGPRELRDL
ncbi:MAG: putative transport system permease protein [Frankiaceae bacterium]|nr:putative transport system permease protein [Frankiaceae bacterium]